MDEAAFMADVGAVLTRAPGLAPLGAAILVALDRGLAADTRSFAKIFGVPHALALRAATELSDGDGLVHESERDPRTQRARLVLTFAGRALVSAERRPMAA